MWLLREQRSDLPARCKGGGYYKTLDGLLVNAGEEPMMVVHVGTNDIGSCRREVQEAKFRLLGRRLRSRSGGGEHSLKSFQYLWGVENMVHRRGVSS